MIVWVDRLEKAYRPLTVALFVGVLLWTLSLAVRTSFGRDENVFVTGGQLIAENGLLPYRDFRHYHTPYLILAYAAIFKFTHYYLLAARFSAACATGVALTVAWTGFSFFQEAPRHYRFGLVWAGVLLLVATPLYVFTTGYAWNHNLATLLALLAFAFLLRSAHAPRPVGWIFASGALLGLSVGTRVSFITALPAFAIAMLVHPQAGSLRNAIKWLFWLGLGMLLALLPVGIFYLLSPGGFVYDNWTYHTLNTLFRVEASYDSPIALADRLLYALNDVFGRQGNLLLFVSFLFVGGALTVGMVRRKMGGLFEPLLILGTVLLVAVGSFLPSPSWYQYFYAPVPFAVCAVLYGLSRVTGRAAADGDRTSRWFAALFCTVVLVANLFQVQEYRRITFLLAPDSWRPVQAHQAGVKIRELMPAGKVLTLTPVFVLDGGAPIYPEFASGPFVWRVAHLMTDAQRQQVNAIAPQDLEQFLANDPPKGILVGAGGEVEAPLVAYAQQHDYQSVAVNDELTLWVAP